MNMKINEKQKQVVINNGWKIEESEDGIAVILDGSIKWTENTKFFKKASYLGISRLWLDEDDNDNLENTICRYRRQYGYGNAFINNILDEDECANVIELRSFKISYKDIINGVEELDVKIEELYVALVNASQE